jgi:hypothetical protein
MFSRRRSFLDGEHSKDLDTSQAVKVISAAQKFILPIPPLQDGAPLVYPSGQQDKDGESIEGQPISDWQGNPVGTSGIVFRNAKDQMSSGLIAWPAMTRSKHKHCLSDGRRRTRPACRRTIGQNRPLRLFCHAFSDRSRPDATALLLE